MAALFVCSGLTFVDEFNAFFVVFVFSFDATAMLLLPAFFAGRVLAFDLDTSKTYAELMARARAQGKAIAKADGYIAATAAAHGLIVATRDTSPFEAGGLQVIDPWEALP